MEEQIPTEVLDAYYPDGIIEQSRIPGGEINVTFLIIDKHGKKTVLQRLSTIYDACVGEDYEVVATHLRKRGWEMATALRARNGDD